MDRRASESLSDSDSGESWMLLDSAPTYTTTEPLLSVSPLLQAVAQSYRDGAEKDDDTDGISIISECDSETIESYEHVQQEESESLVTVAPRPVEQDSDDATDYRDLLGDSTKLKTYVHRRNTRVSSTLNVIVLGSVVTAACLAIGHMWGVRDDCVHQSTSSVNKLLSNLYKLQEENAYLRSKLKELTLAGHGHVQLKRNFTPKQCKKTLEEPPQQADVVSTDKCVDPDADIDRPLLKYVKTELTAPQHNVETDQNKNEFQNDLQKLRKLYEENRSLFERQLAKWRKNEKDLAKSQVEQPSSHQKVNAELKEKSIEGNGYFRSESNPVKSKVSAATDADSISRDRAKTLQRASYTKEKYKHSFENEVRDDVFAQSEPKRSMKHLNNERYMKPEQKIKSSDRYENKHESENRSRHNMKNDHKVGSRDKKYSPDYDMHLNYIHKYSHSDPQNAKKQRKESKTDYVTVSRQNDASKKKKNDSVGDSLVGDWLEKRSEMRRRARQQLHALMPRHGARASARWYFRRMREREHLRASSDRNTRTLHVHTD